MVASTDVADTALIPSMSIAPPKNSSSPIDTSKLLVDRCCASVNQGLLSAENARVLPIKIPGDLESSKSLLLALNPTGSNRLTVPSNLISVSTVVSSVPLYFLVIN